MIKKIKLKTSEIIRPLAIATGVINPKNVLPILSTVRLETKDVGGNTFLLLTTSDSESWLEWNVCCESGTDTDAVLCVDARTLLNALRNLGECDVTLDADFEKHTLTCGYDNGSFQLPFDDADEYPEPIRNLEDAFQKKIDVTKLHTAIERSLFAAGEDELRPIMCGVHFDFFPDCMVSCASDGHKLAKYKDLTITHNGINSSVYGFTLNKRPCATLLNICGATFAGDITVTFNDKCVIFNNNQFCLYARLIEGKYPNYESVIPKNNDKVLTVNKKDIVAAIKRVLPMGSESLHLIVLNLHQGFVTVQTEDIDFNKAAHEQVQASYSSEPLSIGFNGSILLSLLQNVDGEEVVVKFADATRAAVFTEANANSVYEYTSIIMPMAIMK